MATWKTLAKYYYVGAIPDSSVSGGAFNNRETTGYDTVWNNDDANDVEQDIYIKMQYDSDSMTTTSVTVRFQMTNETKFSGTSQGQYYVDEYYAYLPSHTFETELDNYVNTNYQKEIYIELKPGHTRWGSQNSDTYPDAANDIYTSPNQLTFAKKATDSFFKIPEIWYVNTGAECNADTIFYGSSSNKDKLYINYGDHGVKRVYDYFTGIDDTVARSNFKTVVRGFNANSSYISGIKVATDITRGTVNIVDNKNKTITVKGTKPKNGNYNNLTKSELVITFSDTDQTTITKTVGAWSEASPTYSYTINLPDACPASVSATLTTAAPYTSEGSINSSLNITYSAPKAPNTLTYTTAGKNNLKPRYKDDLTWTWDIPENSDGDNTSVEGYRVIIYKNGTSPGVYGVIYKEGTPDQYKGCGVKLSEAYSGKTSYDTPYYELTTKSLTFNPKTEGFKAKDTCYCRVYTYGYGANKKKLYSDDYIQASCLLYNSAVVWIKVNTGDDNSPKYEWKEGVPYVKTSSGWKEAEGVYVKTDADTWIEST